MGLRHSTPKSFYYAFMGMKEALSREPNLRIHFVLGSIAIIVGLVLGLDIMEWIILSMVIFFVIALELLNSVIESLVNLVSPDIKPEAKFAKDVSASVVLSAAILSLVIGSFLFIPKIF